jgi:hydrogenase maturation protease
VAYGTEANRTCNGTEYLQGTRTLIIGYGSPIRGDDAIGPLAAGALATGPLPAGVQVLARHVLTAELVEDIAAADRVIFLDAAADGPPGEVRVRELHPDETAVSTMAHFLDPRELLAWCQTLYHHEPQAWLISAAGLSFDYAHYSLSPPAAAALDPMLEQVQTLLGPGSA